MRGRSLHWLRDALPAAKAVVLHPLLHYFLLVGVVAAVLIWRFPNLLQYPNFYAEDGSVFLQNIIDKGVAGSLLTPFNGYFITGLYLLCDIAVGMHGILGGTIGSLAMLFA
jgi:hypothetical protein